jgi:hypothetical protein
LLKFDAVSPTDDFEIQTEPTPGFFLVPSLLTEISLTASIHVNEENIPA